MSSDVTKVFTITTQPNVMQRIERFFALLHFNGIFGHSNLFGMHMDGDGSEKITIDEIDRDLRYEVNVIGGIGYDVEIASDTGYSGRFINRNRESNWWVGRAAASYKDGKLYKTLPEEI